VPFPPLRPLQGLAVAFPGLKRPLRLVFHNFLQPPAVAATLESP
jgi:hypothetical protein